LQEINLFCRSRKGWKLGGKVVETLLENLFIGIVSGVLSSVIVYLITKSRETKAIKNRELKDFIQSLSRYLRILAFEIEHSMNEEGYGDIRYLKKELIDPPRLIHNNQSDLESDTDVRIREAYNLLGEIETDIGSREKIPNIRLMKYRSELVKIAINILKV
jgi:hypothetical protein